MQPTAHLRVPGSQSCSWRSINPSPCTSATRRGRIQMRASNVNVTELVMLVRAEEQQADAGQQRLDPVSQRLRALQYRVPGVMTAGSGTVRVLDPPTTSNCAVKTLLDLQAAQQSPAWTQYIAPDRDNDEVLPPIVQQPQRFTHLAHFRVSSPEAAQAFSSNPHVQELMQSNAAQQQGCGHTPVEQTAAQHSTLLGFQASIDSSMESVFRCGPEYAEGVDLVMVLRDTQTARPQQATSANSSGASPSIGSYNYPTTATAKAGNSVCVTYEGMDTNNIDSRVSSTRAAYDYVSNYTSAPPSPTTVNKLQFKPTAAPRGLAARYAQRMRVRAAAAMRGSGQESGTATAQHEDAQQQQQQAEQGFAASPATRTLLQHLSMVAQSSRAGAVQVSMGPHIALNSSGPAADQQQAQQGCYMFMARFPSLHHLEAFRTTPAVSALWQQRDILQKARGALQPVLPLCAEVDIAVHVQHGQVVSHMGNRWLPGVW